MLMIFIMEYYCTSSEYKKISIYILSVILRLFYYWISLKGECLIFFPKKSFPFLICYRQISSLFSLKGWVKRCLVKFIERFLDLWKNIVSTWRYLYFGRDSVPLYSFFYSGKCSSHAETSTNDSDNPKGILIRNIYCGQDSSCEFIRLYAVSPSDFGPGSLVARPSRKPYTIQ